MDPLTPFSVAIHGITGNKVSYLSEGTIVFSTGNGLALQDIQNGSQRRIAGKAQTELQSSTVLSNCYGPAVFAVCPEQQLIAYVQRGSDASVHVMNTAEMQPVALIKEPSKTEWLHLSFSRDGSRLTSLGGYPNHQLDIWDLVPPSMPSSTPSDGSATTPKKPPPVSSSGALHKVFNSASIPLGDRLSALGAALFPLNPNIVCACGEYAARLFSLDPIPGMCALRQIDIDLSILENGESLTAFCWTPNGTVLFGTSQGRLLSVSGAAPIGLPGQNWSSAVQGSVPALVASALYSPVSSSMAGSVIEISITMEHVILVMSGDEYGLSQIVWLHPQLLSASTAISCEVGGMQGATSACISPSCKSFVLAGSCGKLVTCDALYSTSKKEGSSLPVELQTEDDASYHSITVQDISRYHVQGIVAMCPLPDQHVLTAGSDGRLQLWKYQTGISSTSPGGVVNAATGVTSRSLAVCYLEGQSITCMAPCRRQGRPIPQVVVGTASGALMIISLESAGWQPKEEAGAIAEPDAAGNEAVEAELHIRVSWELKPFQASITAVAVSPTGDCCVVACATTGKLAFFRLIATGSDGSLQLMGFYQMKEPRLLAFTPPSAAQGIPTASKSQMSSLSLFDGTPPLLVVACAGNELIVVQAPDMTYSHRSDDATIPAGSLTRGLLRTQYAATALSTSHTMSTVGETAARDEPSFWVFAACVDRSVRRYRMLTEEQIAAAKTSDAPPKRALHATQNYQVPEKELSMDLGMTARNLQVDSSLRHLVAACRDGTVVIYNLHDLASHGRWLMHAPETGKEDTGLGCAMAALEGSTLLTVGGDGVLCITDVAPASVLAAAAASRKAALVAARTGRGQVGTGAAKSMEPLGVAEVLLKGPPVLEMDLSAGKLLTWGEARLQNQMMARLLEIRRWTDVVNNRISEWKTRLQDLRLRNAAVEKESERLPETDFAIDTALQEELRAEGGAREAVERARAKHRLQVLDVQRQRLWDMCVGSMRELPQELMSLKEYSFVSQLNPEDTKRWKDVGPVVKVHGVSSYAVRRLSKPETQQLNQIKFLRMMEQEEWSSRPQEDRGLAVVVQKYEGAMAVNWSVEGTEEGAGTADTAAVQQQPGAAPPGASSIVAAEEEQGRPPLSRTSFASINKRTEEESEGAGDLSDHDASIVGAEIKNGLCGLLYSPLQLHSRLRKIAQIFFIQEEIRLIQAAFNVKFKDMHEAKHDVIDKIEDRLGRVSEIQAELNGVTGPKRTGGQYGWSPEEVTEGRLEVQDHEIKAEKYISPEERARREEILRTEEAERRRAEADDSIQRALKEMMYGTLENTKKEPTPLENMKRQPWMDMPKNLMTKEQRLELVEFEKKLAELAEEQATHNRHLEAERKLLEIEVADLVIEFNAKLAALHDARVKLDMECHALELQALSLAQKVDLSMYVSDQAQAHSLKQVSLIELRDRRSYTVVLAKQLAQAAVRRYEELHAQERQLDKAFKREFGSRPDIYDDALKAYRDRRHGLTGRPIRPAPELLSKVPEGQNMAVPPSPKASILKDEDEGNVQHPTVAPDEALKPPALMPELIRWTNMIHKDEGDAAEAPPTRHLEDGNEVEAAQLKASAEPHHVPSGSTCLHSLITGGGARPLDPLKQQVVQGEPVLQADSFGLIGVGLSDVEVGDPFSSLAAKAVFQPGMSRQLMLAKRTKEEGFERLSDAPWEIEERPEGMEEGPWLRLLEMRDTKAVVEQQADKAWEKACLLALALEGLERDEAEASSRVQYALTQIEQFKDAEVLHDLDVMMLYRLSYGQVDLPESSALSSWRSSINISGKLRDTGDILHGFENARFMRLTAVTSVNDVIKEDGADKVELLQKLKLLKKSIAFSQWENGQCDLRTKHAAEELTEMQLMHMTKELQEIMHNPGRSANDKDVRLMKLIDGSTASFKQHLAMRTEKLARITEKVANNIEDHEKLTVAERDAEIAAKETRKVAEVSIKSKINAKIEQKRHLKAMVTNTQLKTIASEQASELERLRSQLEIEKKRTYPILTPPAASRPATAKENGLSKHPDFRLPQIFNSGNPPSRAVTAMPGSRKPTKRVTVSR
ncbi:hypothetical protein CEUSTIGMA_g7305.t1 [Chlamydomonas eustigma]|uniref:Cilia- and flagella-associated protein 43 n=1 Tax=Chlamydomonas eustigma TaxID=1157962 RepID=A0A250X9U0_9CHLO|nr:hypothetical protein CEUSTIGMA_g7305.t1 [Chlamydomonas eustigma]|eukprot:GAX79865.1 hypothetical protein CEUSTIGMA_g7305.t1 [Chlamydomonas eustigma]